LLAVALATNFVSVPAMAIEEPSFQVRLKDGAFEVRTYGQRIIAETTVEGTLSEASNAGFRKVAGYIFGANRTRDGSKTEIAMTAPVTVSRSQKIAMTAPVMTHPSAQGYRLSFVMPAQYRLDSLPAPLDPSVELRVLPPASYAVLRFSGLCSEKRVADRAAELSAWITRRGLTVRGEASLARYDPPWQLPFLRRNEILIPVDAP
jgi:hypothetical protein